MICYTLFKIKILEHCTFYFAFSFSAMFKTFSFWTPKLQLSNALKLLIHVALTWARWIVIIWPLWPWAVTLASPLGQMAAVEPSYVKRQENGIHLYHGVNVSTFFAVFLFESEEKIVADANKQIGCRTQLWRQNFERVLDDWWRPGLLHWKAWRGRSARQECCLSDHRQMVGIVPFMPRYSLFGFMLLPSLGFTLITTSVWPCVH